MSEQRAARWSQRAPVVTIGVYEFDLTSFLAALQCAADDMARQYGYDRAVARVQTMVQLNGELVDLLDREAARRGISRSALIRRVLEESLAEEREASIGRRIAEGYERIPPATPDAWGELAAMTDHASGDLLQRLDTEEREAGQPPW